MIITAADFASQARPDVRITGLRIQGPNTKRYLDHHRRSFGKGGAGSKYYYKIPTSNGISTRHARQTPVVIRGVPEEKCEVRHNWFMKHSNAGQAVHSSGKTEVLDNAYTDKPKVAK
ncbi:MAG: hypothetical protein ACYSTT_18075 [Planctomycetota bacterium]